MAAVRKIANVPFQVPSREEAHPGFGATVARMRENDAQAAKALAELKQLNINLRTNPPLRDGIAELVGDVVEIDPRPARAAELKGMVSKFEEANEILLRRRDELRDQATRAVLDATRPEYGKRVADLVRALGVVRAAYAGVNDIINQLEANDISWLPLGVVRVPGLTERIATIETEAKGQGYV